MGGPGFEAQYNIVDVAAQLVKGLTVRAKGGKAHCPFHEDKHASFYVYEARGRFVCYGCGAKGDVYDLVARVNDTRLVEAAEWLAAKFTPREPPAPRWHPPEWVEDAETWYKVVDLNDKVAEFYMGRLWEAPAAWARTYLTDRGLLHGKVWRTGVADKLLTTRFPDAGEVLRAAGLTHDDGAPVFHNRIIWPVMQHDGAVVGFVGRARGDEEPKYLNTCATAAYVKSRLLYGAHLLHLYRSDHVYLVEGYTDVQAMVQAGFTPTLGLAGTSFSEQQAKVCVGHGYTRVTYLADGDEAGFKAAGDVAETLQRAGVACNVICMPTGEDSASVLVKPGGRDVMQDILAAQQTTT